MPRDCANCKAEIPPNTEHFIIDDEAYCTGCVEAKPYTSYCFYLDGEYMGNSEGDGDCKHIESYDDDYDPEEADSK